MARRYVAERENQPIHRSYGDWVAGTKETALNRAVTASALKQSGNSGLVVVFGL